MVPQLASVGADYGVDAVSTSGFDSVTFKHNLSLEAERLIILHVGDHDPSGVLSPAHWVRMSRRSGWPTGTTSPWNG